eukprot:gene25036-64873_t
MLPGPKLLLVGGVIGAGYLSYTGRLRNAASHAEADAIRSGSNVKGTFGTGSWWDGFLSSWSMILVSEIGDKTFFIACLMAMRHPRLVIFGGAISALAVQTLAAVVLFTGFGFKLLKEAHGMGDEDEGECEELQEAADEIRKKDEEYMGTASPAAD